MTPEQKEEIARAVASNRELQASLNRQHRIEAGELDIELVRAPDDPQIGDSAFQAAFAPVIDAMRSAKIRYSQHAIAFDSVDAYGYPLAEFTIAVKELGPPALTALATVLGAWVHARYGRKVRLKVGEIEVEAATVADAEKLLARAIEHQQSMIKKGASHEARHGFNSQDTS